MRQNQPKIQKSSATIQKLFYTVAILSIFLSTSVEADDTVGPAVRNTEPNTSNEKCSLSLLAQALSHCAIEKAPSRYTYEREEERREKMSASAATTEVKKYPIMGTLFFEMHDSCHKDIVSVRISYDGDYYGNNIYLELKQFEQLKSAIGHPHQIQALFKSFGDTGIQISRLISQAIEEEVEKQGEEMDENLDLAQLSEHIKNLKNQIAIQKYTFLIDRTVYEFFFRAGTLAGLEHGNQGRDQFTYIDALLRSKRFFENHVDMLRKKLLDVEYPSSLAESHYDYVRHALESYCAAFGVVNLSDKFLREGDHSGFSYIPHTSGNWPDDRFLMVFNEKFSLIRTFFEKGKDLKSAHRGNIDLETRFTYSTYPIDWTLDKRPHPSAH